jgi:hypothetical protein
MRNLTNLASTKFILLPFENRIASTKNRILRIEKTERKQDAKRREFKAIV